MEDYNTGVSSVYNRGCSLHGLRSIATLPHEKFYNMAKYERNMDLLRRGETLPTTDDVYDPYADLAAHSSSHKRSAAERDSYLSKEQLQELRKVQQERTQVGLHIISVYG